jgi:hypothetical protein
MHCGLLPSCLQELALDAVTCVTQDLGGGQREIDIKNYAKVEKIPGGAIEDSKVLKGESGAGASCTHMHVVTRLASCVYV